MAKRWITVLFLFLLVGATFPKSVTQAKRIASTQGACLRCNIAGRWEYRVSRGGDGIFDLTQDAQGHLGGSYYSQSSGGYVTYTGIIEGVPFALHASSGETLRGTVGADGLKIGGLRLVKWWK